MYTSKSSGSGSNGLQIQTKEHLKVFGLSMDVIFVAWGGGESLLYSSVRKVSDFLTEGKENLFAGRGPA